MVFDLDSTHKKPYEPLLIGQFEMLADGGSSFSHSAATSVNSEIISKEHSEKSNDKQFPETTIPENQIICSIPCSLHSRKPPLNGTKFFILLFSKLIYAEFLVVHDVVKEKCTLSSFLINYDPNCHMATLCTNYAYSGG